MIDVLQDENSEFADLQHLSSSFPISNDLLTEHKLSKLRTSKLTRPPTIEQVIRFDHTILNRWRCLLQVFWRLSRQPSTLDFHKVAVIFKEIPPNLYWVFTESKLPLLQHANGNPSIPHFPTPLSSSSSDIQLTATAKVVGPFQLLAHQFDPSQLSRERRMLVQRARQSEQIGQMVNLFGKISEGYPVNCSLPLPVKDTALVRKSLARLREACERAWDDDDGEDGKPLPAAIRLPNKVSLQFSRNFVYKPSF